MGSVHEAPDTVPELREHLTGRRERLHVAELEVVDLGQGFASGEPQKAMQAFFDARNPKN